MLLGCCFISFLLIAGLQATCPPGTIHESGFNKCYKFINQNVSFLVAQERCEELGGNLVAVQDGFENSFVAGIAAASASPVSYWIGLSLLYSSQWSWTNKSKTTYENWAPSQNADPSPYQCTAVREEDYHWTKEMCNSPRPFMCTIDPTGTTIRRSPSCSNTPPSCPITCPLNATCDAGYRLYHGTCQCYRADTRSYSYSYAQSTCANEGGHFAFIFSPEENFFLQNLIQEAYLNQTRALWIGLECLDSTLASCAWLDGTPLTEYSNFMTGQPNGQSQIVVLEYGKYNGTMDAKWASPRNPTGSASWICQKDSNLNQIIVS